MNKGATVSSDDDRSQEPTFVSYATADRKKALAVCQAIEKRGTKCWISCRDVEPGENYQEAIVRRIRKAKAVVLVFSEAANNSDEIKKELSLASRYRVPVLALRIEDVEPSDAFAYELSTRQWIDAFTSWDRSLDALVRKICQITKSDQAVEQESAVAVSSSFRLSKPILAALAVLAVLVTAIAAWKLFRPDPPPTNSMVVRLATFEGLSRDVPEGLPNALRDEITAAFTEDGAIKVSTTRAQPPGTGPAYALSGTVRRNKDRIRVIAKLVNERSGTTLWSSGFDYGSSETARIPRWIAVDLGNVLRCGLFAASTYPKSLPDPIFSDYLQFCQNMTGSEFLPTRALDYARKVVAAAPSFSWGWSAVAEAAVASIVGTPTNTRVTDFRVAALRTEGLAAAEKAISLDPSNSAAFQAKSDLIDGKNLVDREALLVKAIAARELACGCEHFSYGSLLQEVGRNRDAIEEYRRSIDVLALNANSHDWLGVALLIQGETKEAKAHLDAASELRSAPGYRNSLMRLYSAVGQDNYAAALQSLSEPDVALPADTIAAYRLGFQALMNQDPQDRAKAIGAITSLAPTHMGGTGVLILASLGANAEALKVIETGTETGTRPWRAYLFYPPLAGARRDPGFPAVAERLGLIRYWKTTHTKPDVCSENAPPPFCSLI